MGSERYAGRMVAETSGVLRFQSRLTLVADGLRRRNASERDNLYTARVSARFGDSGNTACRTRNPIGRIAGVSWSLGEGLEDAAHI
jgi:hypothetical protein